MGKLLTKLLGLRFGKLTVIRRAYPKRRDGDTNAYWLCKCDCGSTRVVPSWWLNSGRVRSCGCLSNGRITHGESGSREYQSWISMKVRCRSSKYYKGRVFVCKAWCSFENFLADMGRCPDGYTLERSNNDGDYKPGNCRWATRAEQVMNRRRPSNQKLSMSIARHIRKLNGTGKLLQRELADKYGVNISTIEKIMQNKIYREEESNVQLG